MFSWRFGMPHIVSLCVVHIFQIDLVYYFLLQTATELGCSLGALSLSVRGLSADPSGPLATSNDTLRSA
jgi:hypothetical protein